MATRAKAAAQDAQVPPTRQTGPESATGVALADQSIPKGKDRGSSIEPEGGHPKPDVEAPKAKGAQLEPARFTSNGQLPHNTVAGPSGPVPVSALGLSAEDSAAKVEQTNQAHDDFVNRREQKQRLTHETIQRLSPQDLRAIGAQRGYSVPETGGVRAVRQAFIEAQDSDTDLKSREGRVAAARKRRKS